MPAKNMAERNARFAGKQRIGLESAGEEVRVNKSRWKERVYGSGASGLIG